MSALEDKILEEVRKLDEAQQQRLLQIIEDMQPKPFDFDEWMRHARAFREAMVAKYGEGYTFGALDILHESRQ